MEKLNYKGQTVYFKSSENMEEIVDKNVDVIITSPPYNVGKTYTDGSKIYNDKKPYDEYLNFLLKVFKECYRVLSDSGIFFLNIGDSARDQGKSEDVVRVAVKAGFKRLQTVIWLKSVFGKGHFTPSGGNRRLNNLWEYVFILVKSKKYEIHPKEIGIPYADKSNIGRYSDVDLRDAGDIWFIPYTKTTGATIKKGHEAPFPIELPLKCLKLVPQAKIVLDPFIGTGSTLTASYLLNRTGFGYEIHPNIDLIKNRLEEKVTLPKSPLLPQIEFYSDFMTNLLENNLKTINKDQIKSFVKNLKVVEKRKFVWACQDLNIFPSIYELINASLNDRKTESKPLKKKKTLNDYF